MNDIDLIKSKLDIVDVISSYVKDLKKAGSNYRAPCPFHNEKTPSFTVNSSLQIFKCFGCGRAGDVIKFIQEIEKLEFPDALSLAAEKAGVILTNSKSFDDKTSEEKRKIIDANTLTAKYYNYILQSLPSGAPGRDYAKKRVIDSERITQFIIGYAPNSNNNLKNFLVKKGFSEEQLLKWGLLVERNKVLIDKFRNRLMHPLFNIKGEIIGFSGRYIGTKDAPKYLNSPETLVFKKNEQLYGLYQAKSNINKFKDKFGVSFIIIVEGNVDILSSHRVGYGNIVAPLGTAFTLNQAKLIKRFADEIFFSFDNDEAGLKALIRALSLAEEVGLTHKVINLGDYQDADELIVKTPDQWPEKVSNPSNTLDYLIDKLSKDLDLGAIEGKSTFSSRIIPILSSLKDEVMISHYVKIVAVILEVDEQVVLSRLQNIKKGIFSIGDFNKVDEDPKNLLKKNLNISISLSSKLEIYFIALLININGLFRMPLKEEYFQDSICKEIYSILIKSGEEKDLGFIESQLSKTAKELFEEIIMFDTSKIKNIDKEINSIYLRIYKAYLKKEILSLKKEISKNLDNNSVMEKLNKLIIDLKSTQ